MRTTTKLQQSKSFKSEANRSDQGTMTVTQQRQEKRNEGGTTKDDSTICKSEQNIDMRAWRWCECDQRKDYAQRWQEKVAVARVMHD